MAHLKVNVVAAEEEIWSGDARQVTVRTTDGDLGILAGHTPLLAALVPGDVVIDSVGGEHIVAESDGGFVSVEHNTVAIVAGHVLVKSGS